MAVLQAMLLMCFEYPVLGADKSTAQMFAVQDSNLNVAQEVLSNGLKIIMLEDHSFPTVSCLMWYHVGSRNETPGLSGLSHLVEHLLFKNAGVQKPGDIPVMLARIGARFNGYTSDDFTAFFETVPAPRLEGALRIEAARMGNVVFTQSAVKEELDRMSAEFEPAASDMDDTLNQAVHASAYQVHPYRNPTRGWLVDEKNLSNREAQAFYDRYFVPNNATLVVIGNLDSKTALGLAEQYFSSISKNSTANQQQYAIAEPEQLGERYVMVKNAGKQDKLEVAYHAPAVCDPDAPVMAVIESLLNAPTYGKLKSALLQNKICLTANSAFELRRDPGLFVVTCRARTGGGQQKLLEAIDGVTAKLCTQPLSDKELNRVRNQCEFSFLLQRNSPYRLGFDLGYFDSVSDWRSAFSWAKQIHAVSSGDVLRVAKKYFNSDKRVIGWEGVREASMPAKAPTPATAKPAHEDANAKSQKEHKGKEKKSSPPMQKLRQAQVERVSVLCYQQDSAPTAPLSSANAAPVSSANGGDVLTGSATKCEVQEKKGTSSKSAAGIANKLPAIQFRSLPNGLRLVVFESHMCPVVQVVGAIEAGQVFDPAGKKGLSELLAASLNSGSNVHSKGQILAMQEDLGLLPETMLHFDSRPGAVEFHTACLSRDLGRQLNLLGEMVSAKVSLDSNIDQIKHDAIAVVKHQESDPASHDDRVLMQNLISPKSPYFPMQPTEKIKMINRMSAADIKVFYDKHIVPGATVLVLAGDITIDQASTLVERALASWPPRSTVSKAPGLELADKRILRTSIPTQSCPRSTVCLGQLLKFPVTSPDYANLIAAGCALTEHPMLARLGLDLSEEGPILVNTVGGADIFSQARPLADHVFWSLKLSVQPEMAPQAVRTLMRELRVFDKTGLTSGVVAEIKRYLAGAIPTRYLSDTGSAAKNILESTMQSNWPDFYQPLLSSVYAITPDSLNTFMRTTFKPDQSTIVVAGPAATIRCVRKQALSDSVTQP